MTSSWIAFALATLAGAPAPSGDEPLPEGALVRLGSWNLRHADPVGAIAFGDAGVCSVGVDGNAHVWSTADGARLSTAAHERSLHDVEALPGGGWLLLTSEGALEPWTGSGDPSEPRGENLGIALALAPSGDEVCVTGLDSIARIASIETGAVRAEIEVADTIVGTAAYAPSGDRLAVVGRNRNKMLRRAGTEEQPMAVIAIARAGDAEVERRIESKERNVVAIAFSADGSRLLSTDDQGALSVWRIEDGALERSFPSAMQVPARGLAVAGELAVLGRDDGTIEVLALEDGASRAIWSEVGAPIVALAASADGKLVAAASGVEVGLFELPELAPRARPDRHAGPVAAVAWSPDGSRVATGSYDRHARVWDPKTGAATLSVAGNGGFVNAVALGERHLVAGGQDGIVRILDAQTGEAVRALEPHLAACTDVALAPDGKTIASAGADRVLRVVDVETGAARHAIPDLPGIQFRVAWSPDGARVAVGGADVRTYDARSGELLVAYPRLPAPLTALAFAPDGGALAAGLADRTIVLLDEVDAPRRFLHGHPGRVTAVAWSPDGRLLASASSNETGLRLWSMPEGAPAGTLDGFEREVLALAFDPAGERIVAGSLDGTALVFAVPERESDD